MKLYQSVLNYCHMNQNLFSIYQLYYVGRNTLRKLKFTQLISRMSSIVSMDTVLLIIQCLLGKLKMERSFVGFQVYNIIDIHVLCIKIDIASDAEDQPVITNAHGQYTILCNCILQYHV